MIQKLSGLKYSGRLNIFMMNTHMFRLQVSLANYEAGSLQLSVDVEAIVMIWGWFVHAVHEILNFIFVKLLLKSSFRGSGIWFSYYPDADLLHTSQILIDRKELQNRPV